MSALADAIFKGGVGTLGVIASAYTLTKFIVATPVRIGDRCEDEKNMDVVICFDTKAFPRDAMEFFVSTVQQQSRLLITPKPVAKKAIAADADPKPAQEEEIVYLVGATADVLEHIRARKDQSTGFRLPNKDPTVAKPLTSGQRIDLIMYELRRLCVLAPSNGTEASIPKPFHENDALLAHALHSRLITQCFPLHDDEERHELVETWVKKWKDPQPLDAVRDYFGDEIGYYFGFLGMYSTWLIVPSLLGVLVFAIEIFSSWGAYGRAIYSLFITSWTTAFLKFWKRRESALRSRWGATVLNAPELEQERPDFTGERKFDDIEERYYTHFSSLKRMQRYLWTSFVTLVVLVVIYRLMFFYFHAEEWAAEAITPENGWKGYSQYVALAPSITYSVVVLLLDMKYLEFATYLTKYENHRTDADFSNALVLKLASFYFVNNFGSLVYLAFWARNMEQLQQTLSSLLITRQLIGNLQEQLIPYFTATSSLKTQAGKIAKEEHVSEAVLDKVDAELLFPTYEGTFDDYLELFVQFGQVTLFASAYPLAALWSLVNNIMEIRSDGFKLCVSFRRSRRIPCQGIGTWLYAFNALGYLSVVTNCAIFGLHSGLLDKLYPSLSFAGVLVAVGVMEHVMLVVKVCIELFVPDTPTFVLEEQRIQRAALRKQAVLQVEMSARRLDLEATQKDAAAPVASLDKEDMSIVANPDKVKAWMAEEKDRRVKLEHEVKTLNELYMRWIREEQEKRKKAEQKLSDLLDSAASPADTTKAK
ncbi:hypothetical protein PINS_up003510 [Pythium insidiosum]|nr:hypothetical protein PINS_up003510 [Pythium insidiosum]